MASPVGSQEFGKDNDTVLQEITERALNITNFQETRKRKSDIDHKESKFISLAESVHAFHRRTPARFRSRPTGKSDQDKGNKIFKTHCTIPESPVLISRTRLRAVDYLSAEEREKKEIEEIKSFKLEVRPVDPKIFQPPKLGKRVAKTPTLVEPFRLTEVKRKEIKHSSSPFHFKAKPVPKGMLEHPIGVPEKKIVAVTAPSTPSFVSKQKIRFTTIEEVNGKNTIVEKSAQDIGVHRVANSGPTLVQPFSFEERNKMSMKQKEEKIKKVLQEEKEARNFHAKPVPRFVKKLMKNQLGTPRSPSTNSVQSDEEKKHVFKAQPASVIHKQPFVPKKPERSVLELDTVLLHTEERAQRRKEFDEEVKQHYDAIEAELQRVKELEEKQNLEEVQLLRQQAIHKAQPIRSYKPVRCAEKIPVTSPKTPSFTNRLKK